MLSYQKNIKIKIGLFFLFTLIGSLGPLYYFYFKIIHQYADDYTLRSAEKQCGEAHLSEQQEKKIQEIAFKMDIDEPFFVRKMNTDSIKKFGYYNAFVYFYKIFNIFPISSRPMLFISEGFFEDLSPEEQLFLIGHEMVHLKQKHLLYAQLVQYLIVFFLMLFCSLIRKYTLPFVKNDFLIRYDKYIFCLLVCLIVCGTNLYFYSYKRKIEWEADYTSLALLKSYDGGVKLTERWIRDYGLSGQEPGLAFLSDHISVYERRKYCLECKKNELIG